MRAGPVPTTPSRVDVVVIGGGIAEPIVRGRFESIDRSAMGHERIEAGRPDREEGIL